MMRSLLAALSRVPACELMLALVLSFIAMAAAFASAPDVLWRVDHGVVKPLALEMIPKDQSRVPAVPELGSVQIVSLTPPVYEPDMVVEAPARAAEPVIVTPRRRPAIPDVSLIAKARKYQGTNPTGWARLWCAKFMAMIAPDAARKVPNPNMARSWAVLPKVKPAPGVIVVLTRGKSKSAGHIGVVTGFDRAGNPKVISGNHNRRVAEAVYSKHRVVAYVSPRG